MQKEADRLQQSISQKETELQECSGKLKAIETVMSTLTIKLKKGDENIIELKKQLKTMKNESFSTQNNIQKQLQDKEKESQKIL